MAIIKTNPGSLNTPDQSDFSKDPTKIDPKKKRLLKEKDRIEDKLKKLDKRVPLASKIREIASILQSKNALNDPNEDPDELYNQISPLLGKLGLKGRIDKGRGDIVIFMDKKKGDEYLYQVKIRRAETMDKKDIDKFDREDFVDSFKWDSDAILLYLWGPYTLPVTEEETSESVVE